MADADLNKAESNGNLSPPSPIQKDPLVLSGKPFVHGTRLSVEFLQGLMAIGWTREAILEVYTYLPPQDLEAVIAYKS